MGETLGSLTGPLTTSVGNPIDALVAPITGNAIVDPIAMTVAP